MPALFDPSQSHSIPRHSVHVRRPDPGSMAHTDAGARCVGRPPSNDVSNYAGGTWGPDATQGLLVHHGHSWPAPVDLAARPQMRKLTTRHNGGRISGYRNCQRNELARIREGSTASHLQIQASWRH
jgi:hypothetical protein